MAKDDDNLIMYGALGLLAYFIWKRTSPAAQPQTAAVVPDSAATRVTQRQGISWRYPYVGPPVIGTVYDPGLQQERVDYTGASKQLPQGQGPGPAPLGFRWYTQPTGTPLSIVTWTLEPLNTYHERINPRLIM
jgi:hypothetical protein